MRKKLLFCLFTIFIFNKNFCQIPAGEVLWLKANTKVVVDTNNKVIEWKDNSIYSNNAFQFESNHQPTLVQNVFGKKPAIFFNGVKGKYFLSNQSSNLTDPGSPRTVFLVGLLDSSAVANGGGDFPSAGGTMFTFRRTAPLFAIQTARVHSIDYVYTAGLGTNSNVMAVNKSYYKNSKECKFIDVFISKGAGTYLGVRQNGNNVAVSQTNPIVSDYGSTGFTVGDREDFKGQDWQGYIAEIIVYNRELDSNEIAQTETYLSNKYYSCFSLSKESSNLNRANPVKPGFILYPNPVNNNLVIAGLHPVGKIRLTITDLTGKVQSIAEVNNTSKYIMDVSKIKSGNYILYIECNGNVASERFVKQ